MKQEFLKAFESIKRSGADKLLAWLEKSDFFTAPASTKHHLACEGGLCKHSLNVYRRLKENVIHMRLVDKNGDFIDDNFGETLAVCGLLHDVCKVNFYKPDVRNVKINGVWEQVPYYSVEEKFPFGHGEKSVFLIERFMRLTEEEAVAIRWHMGSFDDSVKGSSYSLGAAFEKFPLALELHIADLQATYFDEKVAGDDKADGAI